MSRGIEEAAIVLADGTLFEGEAIGARPEGGVTPGEFVFNTVLSGYQEVISDPSYAGQVITFTYPHIGNYGVNAHDDESVRPHCSGVVVRELARRHSNHRAEGDLDSYLRGFGVAGIAGVDTRRLTQHLRDHGSMNGAIGTAPPEALVAAARQAPAMEGLDLVERVTPKERYTWTEGTGDWTAFGTPGVVGTTHHTERDQHHVVVIDLGIKRNILRCLVDIGCRVTAVP